MKFYTGSLPKIMSIQVHLQVLALILKMILGRINAFPQCLCSQIDEVPEGFSMVLKFIGFHITVLSHVSSKRRGTTEGFLTVQIFLGFCPVSSHVLAGLRDTGRSYQSP